MLRTIHLTGRLRAFSKKPIQVEAESTVMMFQCLFNMFGPKFKQIIREGEWHLTRNKKLKDCTGPNDTIGEDEVKFKLGKTTEIWLCPAVRANKAALRIVIGVVLVVVGVAFQMPMLVKIGAMVALGGVSELLAPKPKMDSTASREEQPSYIFNGVVNTNESGGAVPIPYGHVHRANSIVLSAGMTSENLVARPGSASNQSFKERFLEQTP